MGPGLQAAPRVVAMGAEDLRLHGSLSPTTVGAASDHRRCCTSPIIKKMPAVQSSQTRGILRNGPTPIQPVRSVSGRGSDWLLLLLLPSCRRAAPARADGSKIVPAHAAESAAAGAAAGAAAVAVASAAVAAAAAAAAAVPPLTLMIALGQRQSPSCGSSASSTSFRSSYEVYAYGRIANLQVSWLR